MLGITNNTDESITVSTIDEKKPPYLFAFLYIACEIYAVYLTDDFVSGFEVNMLADNETVKIRHIADRSKVTSQAGIRIGEGEHVDRLILGYNDKSISGVRLKTKSNKLKLGDVYQCEYQTEVNNSEGKTAIVGFQMVFGKDRLTEISVFNAPLATKHDFTTQRSSAQHLTLTPSLVSRYTTSPKKLKKGPGDSLKPIFKLYKSSKKNISF